MKKSVLALAVIGAVSGSAFAQSAVSVYGLVDAGVVMERGGASGSVTKLTSGVTGGSRIGFKGNEDLGGGWSALFLLESGFSTDTGALGQGGLLFGRQAFVGLANPSGTILLGRQYTPEFMTLVLVDPFSAGLAGDAKNLAPSTGTAVTRMDNSIKYLSPSWQGFNAELAYGVGEVAGDSAAGRQIGASLNYVRGPLNIRFAYHDRNNDTAILKNTDNARNTLTALTYDFPGVKAHFGFGTAKGLNSALLRNVGNPYGMKVAPVASTDSTFALLGVTVPFGRRTVLMSYLRKNDMTALNQDASQAAIGYRYALSKRSDLYMAYAHISNKNGAGYTVGSAIEAGTGNAGFDLGIRHTF
jgi:predicted porin